MVLDVPLHQINISPALECVVQFEKGEKCTSGALAEFFFFKTFFAQ